MTRAYNTATTQQNSGGAVAGFLAGKNKIINGNFGIWQRGTSSTSVGYYTADRWYCGTDATATFSQQSFTPGAAPVAGYEGQYFMRLAKNSGGSYVDLRQYVEDVRTLAGQTLTLSFWAKCGSGTESLEPYYSQDFGSGGSAGVSNSITAQTITTSWARYSFTFTMPSASGKTIGANSFTVIYVARSIASSTARTIDVWGVQLEAGSVATPFTTATGTIANELTACKRYYERQTATSTQGYAPYGTGYFNFATAAVYPYKWEVEKRTQPTVSFGPSVNQFMAGYNGNQGQSAVTLTAANITKHTCYITLVPSGTPFTQGQATTLQDAGSAASYIEISAEL